MAAPDPVLIPGGPAYLEGEAISAGVEWVITPREVRDVTQAVDGTPRETIWWHGDEAPEYRTVYEMALDYAHLVAAGAHRVEATTCRPGPYSLVLWQHVYQSFLGTNARSEWTLPRSHALDSLSAPAGISAGRLAPIVCVDLAAPLRVITQDASTYDGGTPETDEAWFRAGSRLFKLGYTPSAGQHVTVAHVPVFRVLRAADPIERKSDRRLSTPRVLRFVELV